MNVKNQFLLATVAYISEGYKLVDPQNVLQLIQCTFCFVLVLTKPLGYQKLTNDLIDECYTLQCVSCLTTKQLHVQANNNSPHISADGRLCPCITAEPLR